MRSAVVGGNRRTAGYWQRPGAMPRRAAGEPAPARVRGMEPAEGFADLRAARPGGDGMSRAWSVLERVIPAASRRGAGPSEAAVGEVEGALTEPHRKFAARRAPR